MQKVKKKIKSKEIKTAKDTKDYEDMLIEMVSENFGLGLSKNEG